MQAEIVELPPSRDQSDDEEAEAYREELVATVDPAEIDRSNAEGIALCVEGSGLGPASCASYLRRWLCDPSITAARIRRWMSGEGSPDLRQARALFLLARPTMGSQVSAHLSRLVAIGLAGLLVSLPLLQQIADQTT